MWILRRGASEKLRGRPCQEQTHVLAEQFSSKENIQVEGKSNIQTKVVTTLFADVERDLISERPARALPLGQVLGPEARPPERAPWASSRLDGKEDRNPGLPRTGSSGALTVYFCTNLVGTLRRAGAVGADTAEPRGSRGVRGGDRARGGASAGGSHQVVRGRAGGAGVGTRRQGSGGAGSSFRVGDVMAKPKVDLARAGALATGQGKGLPTTGPRKDTAREGVVGIVLKVDAELHVRLRRLALEERTSLQALGVEALAALLAARGLGRP